MIVRKLEALFTINTNAIQFKRAASELDNLASKAETVMKAIAGYWAVQALQNFVTNTANAMAEVGKSASFLGIAADALQELQYAAEKSGVSIDALNDALKEIQVRAVDAKAGEGEAAEAFQMLGLKSTDAAGRIREPLELLDAVADRLKALPTQSERIWIADAIFGDEGSTVLSMLKYGSMGLQAMRKEARALGLTLGTDAIAKARRFNQALKKLHNVSSGLAKTFAEYLFPPLSWLMEKCAALSAAFNQMESRASLVRTTLLTLGGVLSVLAVKAAIAFGPMILFAGAVLAGITAVALIIDDLWTAFRGGDSVLLSLHKKARVFFGAMEQWLLDLPRAILASISQAISSGLSFIQNKFMAFKDWLLQMALSISERLGGLFNNLVPDFLKKGFAATINHVASLKGPDAQSLNSRLAPQPSNITHQNRMSSQQNVHVAVNVKSQANPHEIGGEVSKAIKQALERERFNAFMGIMNYAS
ncbi:hypothetical protein E6Q11_06210 [Candidatus Dojkabacteria bacterium]|uniref:Phage tail tape measure protein domain-containing protein n=1 Tax=Candidatus Dojkabacteria bacterium TaxID=2099670 RepID=A0A5C7J2X8_9BACT|nr:MAG: hypothetical protein E6Q11_06210 [Candidatus Dojkabacteria bacterium]